MYDCSPDGVATLTHAAPHISLHAALPTAGMLASQLASRVHSEEIAKFAIVRVDKHVCNTIQDRK